MKTPGRAWARWVLVPYPVFALLSCWWLGDFWNPRDEVTSEHSPKRAAQLMLEQGSSAEEIRAMLIARGVDAGALEALLYELAIEHELRRNLTSKR